MIAILVINFIILWALMYGFVAGWRKAWVWANLIFSIEVWFLTESLSAGQWLNKTALVSGWIIVTLIATAFFISRRKLFRISFPLIDVSKFTLTEKIICVALTGIVIGIAVTACVGAPNTSDSMAYHLPRIVHWIQNHSLAYYPTDFLRQLVYPPFAEMGILQGLLISNHDQWVNMVQFFAMITSCISVSLIVQLLGVGRWGMLISVVFAMTFPMGIIQASSTQNDYAVAALIISFVFFILHFYKYQQRRDLIAAGIVFGLACLTKGYAYLYCLPWLMYIFIRPGTIRRKFSQLGIILILLFVINAPYYARNAQAFGKILWAEEKLTNDSLGYCTVVANAIRNTGLHLGTPWPAVNSNIQKAAVAFSGVLGCPLNPPGTAFGKYTFELSKTERCDDNAGGIGHVLLIVLAMGMLAVFLRRNKGLMMFFGVWLVMIVVFNLVLRYQPWNTRFHIALFLLAAPWVGIALDQIANRWIKVLIVSALLIYGFICVISNDFRPWAGHSSIFKLPRNIQYFLKSGPLYAHQWSAIQILKSMGCYEVGFKEGSEYTLWIMWDAGDRSKLRFENIDVTNESKGFKYSREDFQPCAIFVLNDERKVLQYPFGVYARVWGMNYPDGSSSSIFIKATPP